MGFKIRGSHLTCKVANKCLNAPEHLEVLERKKDGLLPSRAFSWIASAYIPSLTQWAWDSSFFVPSQAKKYDSRTFCACKNWEKLRKLRHFTIEKGSDMYWTWTLINVSRKSIYKTWRLCHVFERKPWKKYPGWH